MILDYFDYHAPETVDEAVALLAAPRRPTSILGGGTWLVPDMAAGKARPRRIIDLRRASLDYIREDQGAIRIGAMTTYGRLRGSASIQSRVGVLSTMARAVTGGPQITGRGTIGGAACAARPASDAPACLALLRARMRLVSAAGVREVGAAEFFVGAAKTVLAEGELLSEILVEAPRAGTRFGFYKLKLCESSWPIVTAACAVADRRDGACATLRLAVGGAAATPVCLDLSPLLAGGRPAEEVIRAAGAPVRAAVAVPWADELADGAYRLRVAAVAAARALAAAMGGGARGASA